MMQRSEQDSSRVERALTDLFSADNPNPAFVARLEQQLQAQSSPWAPVSTPKYNGQRGWRVLMLRPYWTAAVLALILIASVVIAAGPQRVWASIQQLVGYVPGIGFTDLSSGMILPAPVEVTREGVTVRVTEVIAGPSQTQIVLSCDGLPPDTAGVGVRGGGGDSDIGIVLRLPDGQTLAPSEWSFRYGVATLQFPALPPGVTHVTLEVARLPLVSPAVAPENWSLPLTLVPISNQGVTERFTQPYSPAGANDTHAGITLRVLGAAHSAEATALRVQATWLDPQVKIMHLMGGRSLPVLRDDLGHTYQVQMSSNIGTYAGQLAQAVPTGAASLPAAAGGTLETDLLFSAVPPKAHKLTLVVDGVDVQVPAEGQFVLDLGQHPQVGDTWPLDLYLQVAGFPVHVTGARLFKEELHTPDGVKTRTQLEFDVEPVASQGGRALHGFYLNALSPLFITGGGGGYNFESNRIRANVTLQEGVEVPPGPLTVMVTSASITETGPWQLSWEVPGQ